MILSIMMNDISEPHFSAPVAFSRDSRLKFHTTLEKEVREKLRRYVAYSYFDEASNIHTIWANYVDFPQEDLITFLTNHVKWLIYQKWITTKYFSGNSLVKQMERSTCLFFDIRQRYFLQFYHWYFIQLYKIIQFFSLIT